MIEKFNFYDIYGYLLPGLALLGVLWLPFGLVAHIWPKSDWGSAILALAFAYLLGHFLQTFGATGLKSKVAPNNRFPSDAVLDAGSLPDEIRIKLAEIIKSRFGIDLGIHQPHSEPIDLLRNHAFFLARSVLIREKTASYAEQYQGMYALTRGLAVVSAWGVAYWAGWATSIYRTHPAVVSATVVLTIALSSLVSLAAWLLQTSLAKAQRSLSERISLFAVMPATLLAVGYVVGLRYKLTPTHCFSLVLAAIAGFAACLRFYNAYKTFAFHFAIAVWRDFLAFNAFLADKSSNSTSSCKYHSTYPRPKSEAVP